MCIYLSCLGWATNLSNLAFEVWCLLSHHVLKIIYINNLILIYLRNIYKENEIIFNSKCKKHFEILPRTKLCSTLYQRLQMEHLRHPLKSSLAKQKVNIKDQWSRKKFWYGNKNAPNIFCQTCEEICKPFRFILICDIFQILI